MEFIADSLNFSNEALLWILLIGGFVGLILVVAVIGFFYLPLRLFLRNLLSRGGEASAGNEASASEVLIKEKKSEPINIFKRGSWILLLAFGVLISLPFLIYLGLKFLVTLIML
ncbi:MAG: hypothetical protein CMI31_02805 [Opitutae bacterium]|nr:hypothetical protein [Opitutae bacterium]